MNKTTLKTAIAATALVASATIAMATGVSTTAQPAVSSGDFSSLIIRVNEYEYKKCGRFTIAVYNQCLQSAGNNSNRIRQCRREYQRGVQVCHSLR